MLAQATNTTCYTTRIIKAGALLPDTRTLLANWDEGASVADNLARFRRENIFGKTSRSRIEDILLIFRQRYLADPNVTRALVSLVKDGFPSPALDRILYFHAAQADSLLHDVVAEFLADLYRQGRSEVTLLDLETALSGWMEQGKTTSRWSPGTLRRVAQGLLATLRDFGILQGGVRKRFAPSYLPIEAFAYVAFFLHRQQPSGNRLVHHLEWRLFFLAPSAVERLFMEAHQHRLLQYHAAGPVMRIDFPADSLEEYAHALTQRSH